MSETLDLHDLVSGRIYQIQGARSPGRHEDHAKGVIKLNVVQADSAGSIRQLERLARPLSGLHRGVEAGIQGDVLAGCPETLPAGCRAEREGDADYSKNGYEAKQLEKELEGSGMTAGDRSRHGSRVSQSEEQLQEREEG